MDLDLPGDIRDTVYDLTHWEWTPEHIGQTALDLIGFLPLIGDLKYVGEAGEVAEDALKGADKIGELAGDVGKNADEFGEVSEDLGKYLDGALDDGAGGIEDELNLGRSVEDAGDKGVNYSRPSGYRKGVRDKVWENAIEDDGEVRDPLTQEIINKDDPWQMGHKPGYEFRKHQQSAIKRGISREEFLDEHNNPYHYRPELPGSNLSHKGEDMTEQYFGP